MMTVEGRELLQPHNPLKSSSSEGILSSLSPGFSPSLYCSWGFSLSLGSSSPPLALLRCLRAPCHLVGLSLLALLAPFAMALSLSIPTAQPNSTGLPHSAQLPRPNSLGPTHSAQFYSLGPTHSAQLTRPTHPNSTQLAWPSSLGPTRPTQLTRPDSPGPTHSA